MASSCSIVNRGGNKKVSRYDRVSDLIRTNEERNDDVIRNSIDEENTVIPGLYNVIESSGLNQADRSNYSRYLERRGVTHIVSTTNESISPNSVVILAKNGYSNPVVYETSDRGNYVGLRIEKPMVVKLDNYQSKLDGLIYNATLGGHDGLIIKTTDKDIVIAFDNRTFEVGDKKDIQSFYEYCDMNLDTKYMDNDLVSQMQSMVDINVKQRKPNSQRIGEELANKMSQQIGVEYEIISKEKAIEITHGETNAYTEKSEDPAFFYRGKVYFIEGKITSESVFHEFAHPVIRGIRNDNRELFDSLYDEVMNSEYGESIYNEVTKNPNLAAPENLDFMKEEVIAKALSKINEDTLADTDGVLNKIMYAIKRFLRKFFGKNIEISNLKPSTTLNELAEILNGGDQIYVDVNPMRYDSIVVYDMINLTEVEEQAKSIGVDKLVDSINTVSSSMSQMLDEYIHNANFEELGNIIGEDRMRELIQSTSGYDKEGFSRRKAVYESLEEFKRSYDTLEDSAVSFVKTISSLQSIMNDVYDAIKNFDKSKDYQKITLNTYYAKHIIDSWYDFISECNKQCESGELKHMLRDTIDLMDKSRDIIKNYYKQNTRKFVGEQLSLMREYCENYYRTKIERIKKAGGKYADKAMEDEFVKLTGMVQSEYDELKSLYERFKNGELKYNAEGMSRYGILLNKYKHGYEITDIKIDMVCDGLLGDATWLNSMVESYTSNQNLIGMSLANYIEQGYGEAMNRANDAIHSDFMATEKLIRDAGLKDSDGTLRNMLCFQDEKLVYNYVQFDKELEAYQKSVEKNPNKESLIAEWKRTHKPGMVRRKVWTFLNPYKNYHADYEESLNMVNTARANYLKDNSDEGYDAYVEARNEHEKFVNMYFHRKYNPRFYEVDDNFRTKTWTDSNGVTHNLGNEVVEKYRSIIDQINSLNEIMVTSSSDVSARIDGLWNELKAMSHIVNEDGTMKDEYGIAFANMTREYKKAKDEFYDTTFNLNRFEDAWNQFNEEVLSKLTPGTQEYQDQLDEWIENNTTRQPSDVYFERRRQLLDEIKSITSKYTSVEDGAADNVSNGYRSLNEFVRPFREFDGTIDYEDFTDEQLLNVREIEENNIIKNRERAVVFTPKDRGRLNYLNNLTIRDDKLQSEYEELLKRESDNDRLMTLLDELREMSTRQPNKYYIAQLNNIIDNLDEVDKALLMLNDNILTFDVDKAANLVKERELINSLRNNSPEFREWFDKYHIRIEGVNGNYYYQRLYVCDDAIVSPEYMSNDTNVEKIIGMSGYMPSYKYCDRSVKDEYVTPLDVGVTVDNMGNFLPLSSEEMELKKERYELINGKDSFAQIKINGEPVNVNRFRNDDYYNLKKNNPKAFKALDALVKLHLQHQQDLDSSSKLYLEVARIRKGLYQGLAEGKPVETLLMKARNMVRIDEEDVYDGLVNFNKTSAICRANWVTGDAPQEPIIGMFDIDPDDCDFSIMFTNEQYYSDIFRHKALVQMNPIVRAIQNVVNDMEIKNTSSVSMAKSGTFEFDKEKRQGKFDILKDFCNSLIGREFEGKFRADNWSGKLEQLYVGMYRYLTKRGSGAYFNIDIHSALKNFLGQKIQTFVEATGGIDFTVADTVRADEFAVSVMSEMVADGYKEPVNSLRYQMVKYFDMIPGRARSNFGKEFANSYKRELFDGANGTRLRKLSEMEATMQIGFAMLEHKKIKRNGQDIKYIDAFELVDGNLRLKSGIDARYDVNPTEIIVDNNSSKEKILKQLNIPVSDIDKVFENIDFDKAQSTFNELTIELYKKINEIKSLDISDERKNSMIDKARDKYNDDVKNKCTIKINNLFFKTMRSSITETFEELNGAYNDYSQPHMNQYLLMKGLMFLRKYYIPMFAHKYAFRDIYRENGRTFMAPRYNVRKQRVDMPVYGDTLNALYETLIYRGENISWMDAPQRANLIRFFVELAVVGALLPILSSLIMFGIDGDDDKYKAQKDKNKLIASWSGTIFDDNFKLGGFMRQAALLQILKLQDEQSQFHPFLKGIQGAYNFGWKSGLVFTTVTVDNWLQSLTSLVGMMNDNINGIDKMDSSHYYTRDTGPYWWQKKGAPKFINYYMKSWGLNGANIDPATSYKNFLSYQNNMRR